MSALAALTIALMALTYIGIGLWVLWAPDHYGTIIGLTIDAATGRSELRVLGALYTIAGGVMLYAIYEPARLPLGLGLLIFIIIATLIARGISLLTGAFTRPEAIYLGFELVFLALIYFWLWPRQ